MAELTLKWEKFGLGKLLHEMLGSRELVDVTLACQGEFIKAHKTVLAAGSPYFREIFKDNPCTHPVVILQDINLNHLKPIVQFMYLGEVTVLQEQLPGFLQTAEVLGVSALVPKNKKSQGGQPTSQSTHQPSNAELPLEDSSQLIRRRRRNLKHTPTKCMPTPESLEPQIQIKDSPNLMEKFNSDPGQNFVPPNANVNDLGLYSSEEVVVVPDDVKLEDEDDEAFSWPMSPLADTEMVEVDPRPTEISTDELPAVIPMDIPSGNSVTITKTRVHSSARGSSSSSSHQAERWMLSSSPNHHLDTNQLVLSNSGVELIPEASSLGKKGKYQVTTATTSVNDPSTSHTDPGDKSQAAQERKFSLTRNPVQFPAATIELLPPLQSMLFTCRFCGESYSDMRELLKHSQTHGDTAEHQCPLCDSSFKYLGNLRLHIAKSHTGTDVASRHACHLCGKTYAHKGDLRVHERNKHPELFGNEIFKCSTCHKTFSSKQALQCHLVKSTVCTK